MQTRLERARDQVDDDYEFPHGWTLDDVERELDAIGSEYVWARHAWDYIVHLRQIIGRIRGVEPMPKPELVDIYRYPITQVDDFTDAVQVHWVDPDEDGGHSGRATISKAELPGLPNGMPSPGMTIELRFRVGGGFLGGSIIENTPP